MGWNFGGIVRGLLLTSIVGLMVIKSAMALFISTEMKMTLKNVFGIKKIGFIGKKKSLHPMEKIYFNLDYIKKLNIIVNIRGL